MKITNDTTCLSGDKYIIEIICNDVTPPRGYYSGKTLDELQAEEPTAQLMTVWQHAQRIHKKQKTPVAWIKIDEDNYNSALNALPPILHKNIGFLIGEPFDHDALTGEGRYTAYIHRQGNYFASNRPMTKEEFKEVV